MWIRWIRNTGLHEELLEDDDPIHRAEVLADLVHNVHGDRVVGVQDRQQDDPIGRAPGRVLPAQLLFHLLRGQGLIRVDATPLGGRTVTGRHYRDFFEEFQNTETGCRIFVLCKAGKKVGVLFLGVEVVGWLGGVLVEVGCACGG